MKLNNISLDLPSEMVALLLLRVLLHLFYEKGLLHLPALQTNHTATGHGYGEYQEITSDITLSHVISKLNLLHSNKLKNIQEFNRTLIQHSLYIKCRSRFDEVILFTKTT